MVTELQSQLDDIERQLRSLDDVRPSELWVLVPISTAPCPAEALVRDWLLETGLPDVADVRVLVLPSRHQALTPLILTPGFAGAIQSPGWHLVAVDAHTPVRSDTDDDKHTAWHHKVMTDRFHAFLSARR